MKKFVKFIGYSLATLLALYFAISGILAIYPNFHSVIPKKIYRSGELSQVQFVYYIKKHHIKSVLNLRGAFPEQRWYQHERKAMKITGTAHYDLKMFPKGLANIKTLKTLTDLIRTAPKPLLIHCWRGSDRTGLASAIALILFSKQPLSEIKQQLSWEYGVFSKNSIGIVEIFYYQQWLNKHQLKNSKQNFLHWLKQLKVGKEYPYDTNPETF